MQFMITSSQTTPCIRGILLPETSGQRYTHRAVCSAADQQARQEKIKNSLEQLQKWMDQANEELPEHLRDSPERLSALLQRCEVKVAYMNLYASLCLQSQEDLRLLASQAGSDDRPVGVADLLEATGGPWLLGLSSQLAAQAVLPAMEEMHGVVLEQLIRTLTSRQTSMELDLSPRDKAALAEQASKLKKNERLLQLRKDSMLPRITSKMAALKTEICQAFAQLGQACKQDCIEQTEHIKEQWDKRISSTKMATLSNSLGRVQSMPKTAAYRVTFGHTGMLASMDDALHAVEEKARSCLASFATQHVFQDIVTSIVECLEAGLPEFEDIVLKQLVQKVADSCVMPSLDGLVKRFVKRLLHPANLKASLRGMQAKCAGTYLLRGPLTGSNEADCRHELMARVENTLQTAQNKMPSVFESHVHDLVQGFVSFLTKNGSRYKGGVERFTMTLVKEIPMHCRGLPQGEEAARERSLLDEAVDLKQAMERDIITMRDQATTPLVGDHGLAASLHKAAKLTAQLEHNPDFEFLLNKRLSPPTSQPLAQEEQWLNLDKDWPKIAEQNLRGSFSKEFQQRLLWHRGLGPPSMSDSEWQQTAHNSLSAALQFHIWPADSNTSLQSQMSERQRVWAGIRLSIAHGLIGIWDEAHVQSWLQKEMRHGEGGSPKLEQYMKRILEPNGQLGLLELLAFMMSYVGVDANSSTQGLFVQLWLPAESEPIVLFHPSSTASRTGGSRRTFVYNLLAVTLPKSQQVVWLPLEKKGHTEVSRQWEQRFNELDDQDIAVNLEASPSGSSTQAPTRSAVVGLRARGRRPGGSAGCSKTAKRARQN